MRCIKSFFNFFLLKLINFTIFDEFVLFINNKCDRDRPFFSAERRGQSDHEERHKIGTQSDRKSQKWVSSLRKLKCPSGGVPSPEDGHQENINDKSKVYNANLSGTSLWGFHFSIRDHSENIPEGFLIFAP